MRSFHKSVELTRPTRTLLVMVLFLIVVGAVGYLLYTPIQSVFAANIYLSALIAFVFILGVIFAFRQVLLLSRAADWLEAFVEGRPGFEHIRPPTIMAAVATLLHDRAEGRGLGPEAARSMLDSVASRLDEGRDIARYTGSLLIFLGLLGTFWGLANTVPAVVETIQTLAPAEGEPLDFARLMRGLEEQLGGMGTAFSSSLLGLAGSLIIGFLELMAGHAQNRFYREFEDALSEIMVIDGGGRGGSDERLLSLMQENSLALRDLGRMITFVEEQRLESFAQFENAAAALNSFSDRLASETAASTRLIQANHALASALEEAAARNKGVIGGMDEATRSHIRSIDAIMLRLLEEVSAGRADSVNEIRAELRALGGG